MALVLLALALLIPQLSWADHASDHPQSQFDDPSFVSPSGADADSARWAALGAYYANTGAAFLAANPEIGTYQRFAGGVAQQTGATFLAANPETATHRRFAADVAQQTGAAFLTANPEIMAYRRYIAQQDCSDLGMQC